MAAALVAAGVNSGCDAPNLDTMPDAAPPHDAGRLVGLVWDARNLDTMPDATPPRDAGPLTTEYRWGDVSIHVAPTGAGTTGSMTLWIADKNNPAAPPTTLMFGDDAQLVSHHGCTGDPTLHGVEILSCARDFADGTAMPGCLYVSLDKHLGIRGNFVQPSGARCDIRSGSADITLPDPWWSQDGRPEAATGSFLFQCRGGDGTDLELEGVFVLPQSPSILLC